jgi:hypothetical protein
MWQGIVDRLGPGGTDPDEEVVRRLTNNKAITGLENLMTWLVQKDRDIPIVIDNSDSDLD